MVADVCIVVVLFVHIILAYNILKIAEIRFCLSLLMFLFFFQIKSR